MVRLQFTTSSTLTTLFPVLLLALMGCSSETPVPIVTPAYVGDGLQVEVTGQLHPPYSSFTKSYLIVHSPEGEIVFDTLLTDNFNYWIPFEAELSYVHITRVDYQPVDYSKPLINTGGDLDIRTFRGYTSPHFTFKGHFADVEGEVKTANLEFTDLPTSPDHERAQFSSTADGSYLPSYQQTSFIANQSSTEWPIDAFFLYEDHDGDYRYYLVPQIHPGQHQSVSYRDFSLGTHRAIKLPSGNSHFQFSLHGYLGSNINRELTLFQTANAEYQEELQAPYFNNTFSTYRWTFQYSIENRRYRQSYLGAPRTEVNPMEHQLSFDEDQPYYFTGSVEGDHTYFATTFYGEKTWGSTQQKGGLRWTYVSQGKDFEGEFPRLPRELERLIGSWNLNRDLELSHYIIGKHSLYPLLGNFLKNEFSRKPIDHGNSQLTVIEFVNQSSVADFPNPFLF